MPTQDAYNSIHTSWLYALITVKLGHKWLLRAKRCLELSISTVSYSYQRAVVVAAHHCKLLNSDSSSWEQQFNARKDRVSLAEQDALWLQLEQSPRAEALIGALAETVEPAELGELGYALASCATLGEALRLLQQYYALIGEGGDLVISQQESAIQIDYIAHYQVAERLRVHAVLICILTLSRKLTGMRHGIITVGLKRQASLPVQRQFRLLTGTNPHLSHTGTDHVRFAFETLSLPVVTANNRLLAVLVQTLEQQRQERSNLSIERTLATWLNEKPGLTRLQASSRLNISERSLVRKLKQHGTHFKKIKTRILQQQAQRLLQQNLSLEQIAELLGYSDASAFIKAYKNWFGRTPRRNVF